MKILLYGATGMIGSRIAAEALARGHQVTAASRSGTAPTENAALRAVTANVTNAAAVTELARGHDVVISAIAPPRDGSDPREPFLELNRNLLAGVRAAGVTGGIIIVGGAGSLRTESGARLVDTPGFPDAYKGEALAHADLLDVLRGMDEPVWTDISPAPAIGPGARTGTFRLGGDELLPDAADRPLSAEDYAIAVVNEAEQPAHPRQRISVAC